MGGSLAAGFDFSKRLRVPIRGEIEYSAFTKAKAETEIRRWGEDYEQSYRVQTLFLNVYYDINTRTRFVPYVGAGLGAGSIKTKDSVRLPNGRSSGDVGSRTVTNFAWNVGLGLGYQITNNITLDASCRFVDLGKVEADWGPWPGGGSDWRMSTKRLYQHQFSFGARFTF